jgi:starvation-inducible DNA-binding protein
MELKIEVADKKSTRVASLLKTLLADEHVLSTRTREAYDNVNGSNSSELRMLFERHRESLDAIFFNVSQRVLALKQIAPTMFRDSLAPTRLTRHNERFTKQDQIIEGLLEDHESMIRVLSNGGADVMDDEINIGNVEFIAELMKQHVEMAGALREWLH